MNNKKAEFRETVKKFRDCIGTTFEIDAFIKQLNRYYKERVLDKAFKYGYLHIELKRIANDHCYDCDHKTNGCLTCSTLAGVIAKHITVTQEARTNKLFDTNDVFGMAE